MSFKIVIKAVIALTIILLLTSIQSCKNPTSPEEDIEPGRRDYVWTVDSLSVINHTTQFLCGLSGSSSSDLWMVAAAYDNNHKLWHYDGNEWNNYPMVHYISPTTIHALSTNEVWIATDNSEIWKYDGTGWYKFIKFTVKGYNSILFEDIYGYEGNLYAVGVAVKNDGELKGIIAHYNGEKWELLNIPVIKQYFTDVLFVDGGDILISGTDYTDYQTPEKLYILRDGKLSLLMKGDDYYRLTILNNKIYINVDKKIYLYNNSELIGKLDLSNTQFVNGVFGRTIKDFFTANEGINKGIYLGHYNGTDLKNLYYTDGPNLTDAQVFDKDVFVISYRENGKHYFIHGKLK